MARQFRLKWFVVLFLFCGVCVSVESYAGARTTSLYEEMMANELPANKLSVGTRIGIKYNRAAREYPDLVIKDLNQFNKDRIGTVMLCLSWKQWSLPDGQLNVDFVNGPLAQVLAHAEKLDMPVILSVHSSFWGKKGDWSIPKGITALPTFDTASSVLVDEVIRSEYVRFLQQWIDATASRSSVVG